jgi:hypothetical protein
VDALPVHQRDNPIPFSNLRFGLIGQVMHPVAQGAILSLANPIGRVKPVDSLQVISRVIAQRESVIASANERLVKIRMLRRKRT